VRIANAREDFVPAGERSPLHYPASLLRRCFDPIVSSECGALP